MIQLFIYSVSNVPNKAVSKLQKKTFEKSHRVLKKAFVDGSLKMYENGNGYNAL